MNYYKDLYMEDVHSAGLEGLNAVKKYLEKLNIILTEEQEDIIYISIDSSLEKLSNGNYRHEH